MIEPFGYTNELQCFSATIIIKNKNSLIGANSYYFAMNKSRKMAFFHYDDVFRGFYR
jgi:acyl-ACP thioesterase